MARIYVDADVLVWNLRGHPAAEQRLVAIASQTSDTAWVAAMQRAEVLFGMKAGEEAITMELLGRFEVQPVTIEIVDLGARLYREWNPRAGTGKNDALLAATALLTDGRIITNNVRHFPMPGLRVEQGWDAAV